VTAAPPLVFEYQLQFLINDENGASV